MTLKLYLVLMACSIACAIIITYYITLTRILHKAHEAKIDATHEKAVRETKEALLAELRPERMITTRKSGWIVRRHSVVINERLCLGELPISGWVEHEVLTDEELDDNKLKTLAESASFFFPVGGATAKLPLMAANKMFIKAKPR